MFQTSRDRLDRHSVRPHVFRVLGGRSQNAVFFCAVVLKIVIFVNMRGKVFLLRAHTALADPSANLKTLQNTSDAALFVCHTGLDGAKTLRTLHFFAFC